MTDANKTAEEREFARVEEERARLAWNSKQLELESLKELQEQIKEEYNYQKDRLESANDLLQIAEDAAAANLLAIQTAEYNAVKAEYEGLKTEYDALVAADDEGTIDDAGLERLIELDTLYYEKAEDYNTQKAALTERQTAANEKAFNRATADKAKAEAAQAAAQKVSDDAKLALDAVKATVTKLDALGTQLNKDYEASQSSDVRAAITQNRSDL